MSDNPPLFGNNLPLWSERGAFRFVAKLLKGRGKASKRGLCVCILTLMRTEFWADKFIYEGKEANVPKHSLLPSITGNPPSRRGKAIVKKREDDRQEEAAPSTRRG